MIDDFQQTENQTQSARKELYEIYADNAVKPRYKKKLIESLDEIYGYDLAFLVGLIMRSEFSGNLNVISQSNEISGISFSEGKITRIDLNDKETFMGELLIKDGFLDRAQLLQLLQDQSKQLGELLIKNKIATKEQIVGILVKQMRLRLSKYINNIKYRVNFSESEVSDPGLSISYSEYLGLAHDWVAGRFEPEWLKLHYMEMNESLIEVPKNIPGFSAFKDLALSKDLAQTLQTHIDLKTFSKIFATIKNEKDQEYFLKCFHYGIMSGQIALKNNPHAESQSDSVLKNIYNACSKKTGAELVETLAHILKYKPTEIDAIFQAINNYVHTYTGDDHDMKNNMFRIVLEMLSKKNFYYNEITKKYSSQIDGTKTAEISKKIVEIYHDLLAKNLFVAIDKLKKLNDYSSYTPKIKLYMVWAKALMIHQNNIKINISELERDFLQILPEDKDSAEYYYVKAILASLKKDENSAHSYYEQSTKLNTELKKYPPFKQMRSFIKKLFKLTVVFFLILGAKAQAQKNTSGAVTKAKLPFVYLNQYFSYKIASDDSVQINDANFALSDMIMNLSSDQVEIELKETLARFVGSAVFSAYSSTDQKTWPVTFKKSENKFHVSREKIANADYVCLDQKNQYSHMQFCKNLDGNTQSGIKSYTVNNQPIEPEGTIILNDTNQKIDFHVSKNNNDFFNLETVQRTILPAKVNKDPNSEELSIQFVDMANKNIAWTEKISLNQDSFPIKLDPLITLKQGIFFNNVSAETGLSKVYLDKGKIQKKYYNKIIAEPIVVYDQLTTKSDTVDALLRSEMGVGLNIAGERYLDNGQSIIGSLSYYSTKFYPSTNTVMIQNSEQSLISLMGGYKYSFSDDWNAIGMIKIQENIYLNQETTTRVSISKSFTELIGLGPEYMIFNRAKWNLSADVEAFLVLPAKVENSSDTAIGTLLEANLKTSYKIDWGRITAGINMANRNQKNDTYTYNNTAVTYKVGLLYLF